MVWSKVVLLETKIRHSTQAGRCAERGKYPWVSIWVNERLKKKREKERERNGEAGLVLGLLVFCPGLKWTREREKGRNETERERERGRKDRRQREKAKGQLLLWCSILCVCVCVCVAAYLCLFVCMNNSGPWRGQPAAVMRRTCIDTKYCWWEAIDPTAICPNLSQEAGAVCSLYSD